MRLSFGFEQQGAQQQSYSMHRQEAWHSKEDYHSSHVSGLKIVPAAVSSCFVSQCSKQKAMLDGSHAMHNGWIGQNMHQNQNNGWSGSTTSSTSYYNRVGSGSRSEVYMPAVTVLNASHCLNGGMFNNALMQSAGESLQTIQEVKYVPAATMRVQEVRYERRSDNWGGDENDETLKHCMMGTEMLSGFQRIEPKRRCFSHQIRHAWC